MNPGRRFDTNQNSSITMTENRLLDQPLRRCLWVQGRQ